MSDMPLFKIIIIAAAMLWPALPAMANDNHINIDVGHNFDWSSGSINRFAARTSRVFSDRCNQPCTIKVRVFVDDSPPRGLGKRLKWLKRSLINEMRRRSGQSITVYDAIFVS